MIEPGTLEGWTPHPASAEELRHVIDLAFDYRGDVTVVLRGGGGRVGYVFNRDAEAAEPFLEMFDAAGGPPVQIPYADVQTVWFTGKDTAAGKSYAAWLERRARAEAESTAGA